MPATSLRRTVLVASVFLLALSGCASTADQKAATGPSTPAATGTRSPDSVSSDTAQAAAPPLTPAQVRAAVRALVRADTGTFVVSPTRLPPAAELAAMVPRVTGAWSFSARSGRSVAVSQTTDVGELTLTVVTTPRAAFAQALFDGSVFAPSCWARTPSPGPGLQLPGAVVSLLDVRAAGAAGPVNATVPLTDALGALGFQKLATSARAQLGGARVGIWLRISDGVASGWAVGAPQITQALVQAGIDPAGGVDVAGFFGAMEDTQWAVDLGGLGRPVSIKAPPASAVIDPGQEACRG